MENVSKEDIAYPLLPENISIKDFAVDIGDPNTPLDKIWPPEPAGPTSTWWTELLKYLPPNTDALRTVTHLTFELLYNEAITDQMATAIFMRLCRETSCPEKLDNIPNDKFGYFAIWYYSKFMEPRNLVSTHLTAMHPAEHVVRLLREHLQFETLGKKSEFARKTFPNKTFTNGPGTSMLFWCRENLVEYPKYMRSSHLALFNDFVGWLKMADKWSEAAEKVARGPGEAEVTVQEVTTAS